MVPHLTKTLGGEHKQFLNLLAFINDFADNIRLSVRLLQIIASSISRDHLLNWTSLLSCLCVGHSSSLW